MTYFLKSSGDTLTAANVNLLMLQGAMRFANAAARDTALSGVLAEGLLVYEDDVNTYKYYTGAAWAIVSEPRQTWTPTVSQPGSIAKTTNWGWYQRANGLYWASCKLSITGAGTGGNAITVSSPITQVDAAGSFNFFDTSLSVYRAGNILPQSTTVLSFAIDSGAAEYGVAGTDGMTNGDVLWVSVQGSY
jgi:hypothetical protein